MNPATRVPDGEPHAVDLDAVRHVAHRRRPLAGEASTGQGS
jgi:hypothetical protein